MRCVIKWFKHISGSLKDSLIFEAVELFGSDAYLVFFGTLELMADEFDIQNPGTVRISLKKLTTFFQLSRQKTVRILQHFDQKAKEKPQEKVSFFADIEKDYVVIKCHKLADLCDNHTQKLIRDTSKLQPSKDEVTLPVEVEVEVEAEKDTLNNLKKYTWPLHNEQIKEASELFIDEWLDAITEHLYREHIFPEAPQFKNTMLSNGHKFNKRAVLHSLNQWIKKKSKNGNAWAYCFKILTVESGNFNEYEAIKSHC